MVRNKETKSQTNKSKVVTMINDKKRLLTLLQRTRHNVERNRGKKRREPMTWVHNDLPLPDISKAQLCFLPCSWVYEIMFFCKNIFLYVLHDVQVSEWTRERPRAGTLAVLTEVSTGSVVETAWPRSFESSLEAEPSGASPGRAVAPQSLLRVSSYS